MRLWSDPRRPRQRELLTSHREPPELTAAHVRYNVRGVNGVRGVTLLTGLVCAIGPAAAEGRPAFVAVPAAEVRTAPHAVAPAIAALARGTEVEISDEAANGWRVATLPDGRRGYVREVELRGLPLAPAAALVAPPPSPSSSRGAALRLGLRGTALSQAGIGVGLSGRFGRWLAIETTLALEDFGKDHRGAGVEALGRAFLGAGSHLFGLGLGPSWRWAPEFGSMGFLAAELAYELRPAVGFTLLVGAGVDTALNDSGQAQCTGGSGWFPCGLFWTSRYDAGDSFFRFRVAAGYAF